MNIKMCREVQRTPERSQGEPNFRPSCESIAAVAGQEALKPYWAGAQVRWAHERTRGRVHGDTAAALSGTCVGLKIGLAPARVAGP
jgi:hypothetical protein